jgi:hypothetical protein
LIAVLTTFPALSVQLPLTGELIPSGPAKVIVGVHVAMPENAVPVNATATGWSYHPLESGERAGMAEIVGLEVSAWIVYCWLAVDGEAPPQVAEHENVLTVSEL